MKWLLTCSALCWLLSAAAFAAPKGYFDLQPDVMLETGDSWIADGNRYRLFGFRAFPRGATFMNKAGEKKDRGEASLAVLAAYIKDTRPVCAPVTKVADAIYVTCYAAISGYRLDLAMILISSGYALATRREDDRPQYAPYAAAELQAREHNAGLWQFISTGDQ